jgi:D-3-phosphoglycerate dehydrogenase / 2-oxoglutarate reductase
MGMQVIFYDVFPIMVSNILASLLTKSLGTAKQLPALHQLLRQADFVTLHVPESPETKNMISRAELEVMKTGSYLINASRGTVVDIPALIDARRSGKIAGFALDVYPNEPPKNGEYFDNNLNEWGLALRSLTNIIITPHIGGSTEEAQSMIGVEVADSLLKCML